MKTSAWETFLLIFVVTLWLLALFGMGVAFVHFILKFW